MAGNSPRRVRLVCLWPRSHGMRISAAHTSLDTSASSTRRRALTLRDELETIRDKEDEYRENIPESLQGGEKYELSESASDSMNEALDSLDEAISSIESAAE